MIPETSVWAELPAPAYPTLAKGTTRADVAIIGGGLTGLSAAYHLLKSRPGARVVVLEAERLGAGASGRTTGMLGPGVGQSFASLVKRLGKGKAQALYRATLRAVEYVRDLVSEERIECELEMTGQIVVARSQGARARLAMQSALFATCGLPYEPLDDEALALRIHLAPPPAQNSSQRGPAALRLPVAGILHPMKLVAGLAERVIARGGQLFEGARVIKVSDGRPVRVEVHGGSEVVADDVVAATAGYTPEIGLLHGRILPVHLQVLVSERLTESARELIGWNGREGMLDARRVFNYYRLTADDRIVFGGGAPRYRWGGNTDGGGVSASAALRRLGVELDRTFPSGAKIAVAKGWTGVIGYVADALPAIQRSKRNPAVLHVVGWCGHGVALSVASGQWVSALICDGAAGEDLPWFRNDLPLIPSELARWAGFQSSVTMMSLLDRIS